MTTNAIVLGAPIGLLFGVTVHLSGVSSPQAIRGQFVFTHMIMMKMFMGGLAGSAFSLALLSAYDSHAFDKARETRGFGDKGAVSAVLGGLIQGAGMALGASCPGMTFAQLGAGLESGPAIYSGGLAGAFLYSALHPWLKDHHAFDFAQTLEGRVESMHLERVFFSGKFIPIALSFGAIALSTALGLEVAFPWRADLNGIAVNPEYAINPTAAGMVIGALQIPAFLLLNTFLGASSGYSVTTSQVLRLMPEEFFLQYTYAKSFISSKASWQVFFGAGIMAGAALASNFAQEAYTSLLSGGLPHASTAPHVPSGQAFLGGLLIVFGARFVGGCASGHGLSGLPSLHVVSWLTVPSIFAGAILTGTFLSRFVLGSADYMLTGA